MEGENFIRILSLSTCGENLDLVLSPLRCISREISSSNVFLAQIYIIYIYICIHINISFLVVYGPVHEGGAKGEGVFLLKD